MNSLFFILVISVFITLFYKNETIKLRYVIADGLTITAALICSSFLMSLISCFGDLGVFKMPMAALACAGFYSILTSLILKENAVGIVLPTAMVLFLSIFDFSFTSAIFYGLLLTVLTTVLHTVKMRTNIHAGKSLSDAPIILCSAGLLAMIIDAIK